MQRFRAAFVIAISVLVGCSDAKSPSEPGRTVGSSAPTRQTFVGTVIANSEQRLFPAFELRLDDGTLMGLDGTEARPLGSVIGAQVQIEGVMNGDSSFEVDRFLVLAVGGAPVLDGVLEAAGDGAYVLRLTTGGDRGIVDPPADLASHVGERIWLVLTQDDGASPMTFGVIRA